MKIQIMGYSGSGKSTFAKQLGTYYDIPVLHMDAVHFKENWMENDKESFVGKVNEVRFLESWVIDGTYSKIVPERFSECNMLFFFNFNRIKSLYGAVKRYYRYRGKERDSMAKGCLEKFDFEFFIWIIWKGRTKQKKLFYKNMMKRSSNAYVFKNRKQVNQYLRTLGIMNK